MRALVVGAGSVGGYFGGRLAASGRDVTFLVSKRRAAELSGRLTLVSRGERLVVPVKTILAGDSAGEFDLIFVSVKAYQLEAAAQDFRPYVGEGTMILPVLNGMKHMDTLRSQFGAAHLVGGVAKLAASLGPQGEVLDHASFHELSYGELDGTVSARMQALDKYLRGAGFDTRLSREIEREMWEKWALLASLGAVTCLMEGDIGQVARAPAGIALAEEVLREVTDAVALAWKPLAASFVADTSVLLTNPSSTQTSSMYRDMKAGAAVEADQIIGDLLARSAGGGGPKSLLSAAFTRLKVYEQQRKAAV
jgi:2-dehydropantoate 2-reductase